MHAAYICRKTIYNIYKTRFGAKQISTKLITQNSFRKFSIVPACVSYRMTFYMQIGSP